MPQGISEAVVTSTVATKHYGVEASSYYNEKEDDSTIPRSIDKHTGRECLDKVSNFFFHEILAGRLD